MLYDGPVGFLDVLGGTDEKTIPVAGSLAVRENEISKETDIRALGEMCLACGHRQHHAGVANFTRHFLPVEWQPVKAPSPGDVAPHVELDRVARE